MAARLITKLMAYLVAREGFLVEEYKFEDTAIFRDVFGYRYELKISVLGRTHDDRTSNDFKLNNLDFSEVNAKNG